MADIKYTMPQPTEDKDVRSMADIKYTMPPPTEDTEQMCLFRWADLRLNLCRKNAARLQATSCRN